MKKMNPNFISYLIKKLDNKLINKYPDKNFLSWTIRTPELLEKAISLGVNNIIFEKIDLDELKFDMSKLPTAK